jgi:hypothetical protein
MPGRIVFVQSAPTRNLFASRKSGKVAVKYVGQLPHPLLPIKGTDLFVYQDTTGNPIKLSDAERNVVLELYKDNVVQGRHHEAQRSTITTFCFAFAGAFLGLIAKDGTIKYENRWLTVGLIVVSLLGLLLNHKLYERVQLHMERARNYRSALNSTNLRIDELKWMADETHAKAYKIFHLVRYHWMWSALYFVLTVLGIVLARLAWCAKPQG